MTEVFYWLRRFAIGIWAFSLLPVVVVASYLYPFGGHNIVMDMWLWSAPIACFLAGWDSFIKPREQLGT